MEDDILKDKTLLIVDDEADLRDIIASELGFLGAKVFQAENISVAQKLLGENKIDLIISDIRMPGGTGVDLLDYVKSQNVDAPPVILITGFADISLEDAFDKGAEALINKPFRLDDLIKMVVRYTSPFDERFKEPITAQRSIRPAIDGKDIQFGRGGVALPVETDGKKFDVGETINFDFNFQNKHFSGLGICRWFKNVEQGSNKGLLGIEIVNLSDQSLNNFRQMVLNKTVPYIPSLKA